jgi:hypothetical protein
MRYICVLTAAFAMLFASQFAYSQATGGTLVGRVIDPTQAAVPNARVDLTNIATGVVNSVTTNATGDYRFTNLPTGHYNLKVTAPGFAIASLQNIDVELNMTATANVSLKIGPVSTTVEVTEAGSLIDTTTAQIGSSYESREAVDVPLSSAPLGVLNLSLLSAGVASSGGIGLGDGPSVGGQRPRNNNFTVEGVDNTRKDVTGHNIDIPNEAVAEFSVLQNQYSAEFGNGTGGQFNTVIRSGTNEIHGAAYEYFQNRDLNALDQSLVRNGILSQPRFDQNTLGGSVGGPVIKNKLFYYGLFQYNPLGQQGSPTSSKLAPTADGYSMLGQIPGISQTNLNILKQYVPAAPSQTTTTPVGGQNVPIGILPILQPLFTNTYTWLTSVDYDMSSKDSMRGRYVDVLTDGFSSSTLPDLPAFFQGRRTTQKLFAFSEFHNFSPSLINELRLGYNRYNDNIPAGNFQFPGLDSFPNIQIQNDLNLQIGPYPDAPQSTVINTYQIVDNVSYLTNRHSWKFGVDGRKYIAPTLFTQRQRGDYDYTNLAQYLFDLSPNVLSERNVGAAPYDGNQINFAWFANDEYKLRPNLTLNLGVRYEYKGVPKGDKLQALNAIASVPGLIDFRAPKAQTTNFMPRIGIAYSPGNKGTTSIRAGFGMSYDKYFDNLGTNSKPPELESTVDTNLSANVANFLAQGGIQPNGAVPAFGLPPRAVGTTFTNPQDAKDATSAYIYDQQLPYAINWSIGVQHVLHNDYTIDVRYLGDRGVHLITQNRINVGSPVTPSMYLPTYLQTPSSATLAGLKYTLNDLLSIDPILPQWAAAGFDNTLITAFPYRGNSTYHGLAVQVSRRFRNGLQFQGAYTWSHNIDDSTADLFSTLIAPRRPQDFQNMRAERSSSFLDRRQRFTFTWVYDVPWYKNSHNWFLKNLVGNYMVSGDYIAESAQPATVQSGLDSNLNFDSAGDRAIINVGGTPQTGSAVTAIDRFGNPLAMGDPATVAYVAQNSNAQYIQAGYGALANGGRMTLPLKGINNWDLNVRKAFNITESKRFEISAQAYNLFNHPQYIPGYVNNVQFHDSVDTRNNLIPGNAIFNRPDLAYASNARTMQLVARFVF